MGRRERPEGDRLPVIFLYLKRYSLAVRRERVGAEMFLKRTKNGFA